MEIKKLKLNDKLKIKDKFYEVLNLKEEATIVNAPDYKTKKIIAIYLHDANSNSLHPTHCLQYFPDTKQLFISEMNQPKLPKAIETKFRGNVISFINKIKLNMNTLTTV